MAYSIFRRGTVLKGLLRKYISPGLFFLKRYILIAVNSSSRLLKFFNFSSYRFANNSAPQLESCETDVRLVGASGGSVETSQAFLAASSPLFWR